jgi:hypothetical protein
MDTRKISHWITMLFCISIATLFILGICLLWVSNKELTAKLLLTNFLITGFLMILLFVGEGIVFNK